jgi:two-component system phosphate regulon sensor histidine kinase PhoR
VRHAALHELVLSGGSAEIEVGGVKPRRLLARTSKLAEGGTLVVFFDVTELRRLENVRRDFVANVSHELRTPVTAVRSAAETLRVALERDPASAGRFVDIIERNAERLQDLVEDVLELSRIESRQYHFRPESLELEPVLARSVDTLRERRRRRASRSGSRSRTAPTCAPTGGRLEQVLANLVDNAIKYCARGRRCGLRGAVDGERATIAVADDGPGIAAEHLPRPLRALLPRRRRSRARERRHRPRAVDREAPGRGDGRPRRRQQRAGKGSTFSVSLPA